MNDEFIVKTVELHNANSGHKPVEVNVNDRYAAMPIRIARGDQAVQLRWSEWDEVRDHVETAMPSMKPDDDDVYAVCNALPGLVPYVGLPCILEDGHDSTYPLHIDRRGRSWSVE